MADPKPQQQEPSMEEILASIRRIISEDDSEAPRPAAAEETPAEPPPKSAPQPAAAKPAPAPKPAPEEPDDVLDLTDKVADGGTVVPLTPAPAEPATKAAPDEVELREVADETTTDAAPAPEPVPEPRAETSPTLTRSAPASDLVSQATAQAATASLAALAQAVDRQAYGAPIGFGGRTLEDLVKEIMRPIIRDWLDANLPGLVERLVRREIERMAHDAQD
jgi:uncharacterized protein